jgi:hypothetical protein
MHGKKAKLPAASALIASAILFFLQGALAAQGAHYAPNSTQAPAAPAPRDLYSMKGAPAFSVWMYGPDYAPAHWLGLSYQGKELREPINVLIKDSFSKNPEEAMQMLMSSCREAGFPESGGHSTGYSGYIAGRYYGQIPVGKRQAFSDGVPEFANDHGRIFGPYFQMGAYWFVGAFSRENVNPISKVPHHFVSFDQARDSFAAKMDRRAGYETIGYLFLGNYALPGGAGGFTTGDHDGVAVFLNLRDPSKPRAKLDEEQFPLPTSLPAASP